MQVALGGSLCLVFCFCKLLGPCFWLIMVVSWHFNLPCLAGMPKYFCGDNVCDACVLVCIKTYGDLVAWSVYQ